MSLILLIMVFITRSLVAALVIVGTVALSLGASFGTVGPGVAVHLRHPAVLDRRRHWPSSCCWRWEPTTTCC